MAGNTKALRVRIKSVTSTLQLTKAMELVASSKIRKANETMIKARQYSKSLNEAVEKITADRECQKSPYMRKGDGKRTKIIVIAGDRGLAGGYNANVFRLAAQFDGAEFIPIGKRACERFSQKIVSSEHFSFSQSYELSKELCKSFVNEEFDSLGIIYTKYVSVMTQTPEIKWLLPFENKGQYVSDAGAIFEPDPVTVFEHIAEEYVAGMITSLVRESFASEVAARRMAMDSAGKNAKQMIDDLCLEYNRARQGAITQEITEIVAGSEI